jgi:hypothetical protein
MKIQSFSTKVERKSYPELTLTNKKVKMKTCKIPLSLFLVTFSISCVSIKDDSMEQKIKKQLTVIDSLLRSADFNLSIAKVQDW